MPKREVRSSSLIKAIQGNFDHLMGLIRNLSRAHNLMVDDLEQNIIKTQEIDDTLSEFSHDELADVSANDHHAQAHDQGDHDRAEAGDLAAVAAAAGAGTSVEVPNADHVHAHGTGYAGAHSDAVNDGDTAGGDLSGTYPNPSVTDDSHAHTSATAPGTAHPDLTTHDGLGLATDAELAAHTGDTADAHDASAISIADSGSDFTATDVEGALAELQQDNEDHVAAADPHTGYRLESADHTHATTGAQAGQLDHGTALTGLTDDDHPQYIKESEFAAKGDLLGGTGAGTLDNLTVGTDGQILYADSAATTGLAWDDAPVGGGGGGDRFETFFFGSM